MNRIYLEEEYQEAALIWREDNPDEETIKHDVMITISSGKKIPLGTRVNTMRQRPNTVTEEQKKFWKDFGVMKEKKEKYTEEEYREAAIIWRTQDSKNKIIPQDIIVEIGSGKKIPVGARMSTMRRNINALTDEQRLFWTPYGLMQPKKKRSTEETWKEAAEIWKKENPNEGFIDSTTKVKITSGQEIPFGTKVIRISKKLDTLPDEEREFWTYFCLRIRYKKSIKVKTGKKNSYTEEEYQEAALIWRSKNPNVKKIPFDEVITISSKREIPLGVRMNTMRQNPENLSTKQKNFWKYFGLYEEKIKNTEEEYREAALIWRKENPNELIMKVRTKIAISSGKEIDIGQRLYRMRRHPERLTEEEQEFWTPYGLYYKKEESTKNKKLDKYTELYNGDIEKAKRVVNCLDSINEKRKSKRKQEWTIDNILDCFNVDIELLGKYLNRTKTKEKTPKSKILEYKGMSLRKYCIANGYNYEVIARAVKLKDFCKHDTLEQLINRSITTYNQKGQKQPATWIYEIYGNLIKHILLYLNLDSTSILKNMTKYTINLEEAIRHEVFKNTIDTQKNNWLEELYNYLIEQINENKEQEKTEDDIADLFINLIREYNLTKEEYQVLWKCFEKYIKTMKEYQKVDVGLETNTTRRLEKIKDYNLDEVEIEESFYIPLEFDKGVLLGRQSELYKIGQLLRQYTIDWDYYTEVEKEQIKLKNNFTDEEILYIEKTRDEINTTINTIKR